jgi:type II secretory pathway component PulL
MVDEMVDSWVVETAEMLAGTMAARWVGHLGEKWVVEMAVQLVVVLAVLMAENWVAVWASL